MQLHVIKTTLLREKQMTEELQDQISKRNKLCHIEFNRLQIKIKYIIKAIILQEN